MLAFMALLTLQETPKAEDEFTAVTNVRVITMGKTDFDSATILIKNGKIAEIGKDVKVPDGATVVDGKGLTAMPGFVNPYASFSYSRMSGGGSTPQNLAYDEFNPALDVFETLPRTGFTTFAIIPGGGVIAGQGLAMKLNGLGKEGMVVSKSAFLRVVMRADTGAKDTLRREFDAAKKAIEAEKKYEEEKKKYEEEKKKREEAEKKKEPGKTEEKKDGAQPLQEPKPPQKPDARLQALISALKGELPIVVQADSPAAIAHFWLVMKEFEALQPRIAYVCASEAWKAAEEFGERKACVLLAPRLEFLPFTRDRVNPAAELAKAGAKVGLLVVSHEDFLFQVAELVKFGLPRDAALRAFTIHPAEMLGIDKTTGSLEAGKDADVVLLSGDPLAATTRVVRVLVQGRVVYEEGK
ncbi:MAG: amidohydrolase family protein [Planctomycetes bacterium]|nr:amidohydrolase family protein [Planctomycetota bacterium]